MTEQEQKAFDQMREALEEAITYVESPSWSPSMANECRSVLTAANAVSHPQATEPAGCKRDPLDLGQYVNDAHISANDKPVAVIEKLQAVINERKAHHGK